MDTLIKRPGETILYDMNMRGLGRLSTTDNIASILSVVSDVAGINITNITDDGKHTAQFSIDGGSLGKQHKITVTVQTVGGDILIGEGILKIEN